MSADNGIYVLYTEGQKGPEYRVTYAQGIDSIYGKFNEESFKWDGDVEMIREIFHEATVFHNLNEALDHAEEMEQDYGYLEDGICVINEFKDHGIIF